MLSYAIIIINEMYVQGYMSTVHAAMETLWWGPRPKPSCLEVVRALCHPFLVAEDVSLPVGGGGGGMLITFTGNFMPFPCVGAVPSQSHIK